MRPAQFLGLLLVLAATTAYAGTALPDLSLVTLQLPHAVEPGERFSVAVNHINRGATATDVTITVNIDGVAAFPALPENCGAEGSRVTCAYGTVDDSKFRYLQVFAIAPAEPRPLGVSVEIRSNEMDARPDDNSAGGTTFVYRMVYVTHTGDRGAGSLRDAIDLVNAACISDDPCKIAFRIPAPASVHRIEPETPLPPLAAHEAVIDGSTQTRDVGNTNIAGPEIELNGARLDRSYLGNGLVVGCGGSVTGIVINGFPSNGVLLRSDTPCRTLSVVSRCYIGTDATGSTAVPNVRGVYVDGAASNVWGNVISGNERSGVFVARGAGTIIAGNFIGLDALRKAAIPNGASGVAIVGDAERSRVSGNAIAFNAHHGIAVAPGTAGIGISGNSFQSNDGLAIDNGIDGVGGESPVPIPELVEAREHPLDSPGSRYLLVTGTATPLAGDLSSSTLIEIYASRAPDPSGFGEGELYLGFAGVSTSGTWFFSLHLHLPGGYDWITVTATEHDRDRNRSSTSEFSRAAKIIRLNAGTE